MTDSSAANPGYPRKRRKPSVNASHALAIIGWREWMALPDFGVPAIKAKIDTGARTSSIHAFHVQVLQKDNTTIVSFSIHPLQRSARETHTVEAELLEYRRVRTSGGHVTRRPVVVTHVELMGLRWPVELTLANRDTMGFRMLLGREAVRDRFLVNPGLSYVGGRLIQPKRKPPHQRRTPKSNTQPD